MRKTVKKGKEVITTKIRGAGGGYTREWERVTQQKATGAFWWWWGALKSSIS